jgi:YHS domain-containing protein
MKAVKIFTVILAVSLAFAFTACGKADAPKDAKSKAQILCPVMGDKIDKQFYVDYKGERVYFCCKQCIADFNKEPEKYMKKLRDQGVELEKAPAADKKDAAKK